MDYFSEIVEDDSTLVLNNYDNYEEFFENDSLDSLPEPNATKDENAAEYRHEEGFTKILGELHDAEEIVAKLLKKGTKPIVKQSDRQSKDSSAPERPVRPSSAPLRSSRSKGVNINKCHRMLSAYGVAIPDVDVKAGDKPEESLIRVNKKAQEDGKRSLKHAHRSVPSSPGKSSILAWTDSYSLDSTNRIGFSNAYDYNYHNPANNGAPFVIIDDFSSSGGPDTVEINSQLAIRRMNAKNHIQRSSSDNAIRKGSKHNKTETGGAYVLNNYQIQSFDNEDSDVNYLLFNDHSLEEDDKKALRRRTKSKQQQQHKWVYMMDKSLLHDNDNADDSLASDPVPLRRNKEGAQKTNSSTSSKRKVVRVSGESMNSTESMQDTLDFIVSDVFSTVFDKLLHDFLSIIVRNRPHSTLYKGFRCGTFQVRRTVAPTSPAKSVEGKGVPPTSPGQQSQQHSPQQPHHGATAGSESPNGEEARPRKYSDRLSYFVASHSARSTLIRPPVGGHASSTNHSAVAHKTEQAKVIDNFTFVNKDRQPLPHVKQLMYDLQTRINAHKNHSS